MTGQAWDASRTMRVIILLAESTGPLSVPQLIALLGEDHGPRPRRHVANVYSQTLCKHERKGRVARAGHVPTGHTGPPAVLWRITDAGRAWLAEKEKANIPGTKWCPNRGHTGPNPLPLSEFYLHTSHQDGLSSDCKECVKAAAHSFREASQQETLEKAEYRGEPWMEFELETALRTDITVKEAALMLGRTLAGVHHARHVYRSSRRAS